MPSPFPTASLLEPQFVLRVCPFCGMPCEFKFDKKNRPYLHCQNCWTRVFFYTPTGLTGAQMLQDCVLRYGPGRWATDVARRVMEFVKRAGGFVIRTGTSAMHRLLPPSRTFKVPAAVMTRPVPRPVVPRPAVPRR